MAAPPYANPNEHRAPMKSPPECGWKLGDTEALREERQLGRHAGYALRVDLLTTKAFSWKLPGGSGQFAAYSRAPQRARRPTLWPASRVSFSESLCEKSGRWGLVPLRLRGFPVKWDQVVFWARGKGCGWERDSRFWALHSGSRVVGRRIVSSCNSMLVYRLILSFTPDSIQIRVFPGRISEPGIQRERLP
jgi:hypothetical protein